MFPIAVASGFIAGTAPVVNPKNPCFLVNQVIEYAQSCHILLLG